MNDLKYRLCRYLYETFNQWALFFYNKSWSLLNNNSKLKDKYTWRNEK